MNTELIKDTIRTVGKMTYAETVNNQARLQILALWEIALQISMLREEIAQSQPRSEAPVTHAEDRPRPPAPGLANPRRRKDAGEAQGTRPTDRPRSSTTTVVESRPRPRRALRALRGATPGG